MPKNEKLVLGSGVAAPEPFPPPVNPLTFTITLFRGFSFSPFIFPLIYGTHRKLV